MTLGAMRFFAVRQRASAAGTGGGRRSRGHRLGDDSHIENIEPSFMARPMSPLTFSLPDMKSI